MMKQSKIFIISGPSRSGKNAIIAGLLKIKDLNLEKVVTATTRNPRPNEKQNIDHYFISKKEFKQKIKENYFLEWAKYNNNYYGTPKSNLDKILKKQKNPILEIEVQGANQIKNKISEVIRIFIKPDTEENLIRRMNFIKFSAPEKKARLKIMRDELSQAKNYDYQVINRQGRLKQAIEEVAEIIRRAVEH